MLNAVKHLLYDKQSMLKKILRYAQDDKIDKLQINFSQKR